MYGNDFSLSNIINIPIQFQVIINELSETANKSRGMRGGMRGGGEEMGGGEVGERPEMPTDGEMPESLSFSRKSFTANFKLSAGK
jgi:hypothetical protein